MIAVTGNTLGEDAFFNLRNNETIQSMSKGDYLVILGNCGITQAHTDFHENIMLYRDLPCSILFLDGGHDDYDLLSDHPVFPWNGGSIQSISRGITHLMRGQVYTISGKRFFTMGGSTTPGRKDIGKYYDWWPEQDIFPEELSVAEMNLEEYDWKVDWVFTCECPSSWKERVNSVPTPCSDALQHLVGSIRYGHWYFSNYLSRDLPEQSATSIGTDVFSLD